MSLKRGRQNVSITSTVFVFLFLPLAVAIHKFIPEKIRNPFLLAASAVFYWLVSGKTLSCVLYLYAVTLITWLIGIHIREALKYGNSPVPQMVAGIIINVAGLAFFKYFVIASLPESLDFIHGIAVPIGISFFTFKNISYLHEICSGEEPESNFINYALYATFFPQVMQGPIQTYKTFRTELKNRVVTSVCITGGLESFIIGFGMKQLIALKLTSLYSTAMNWGFDALSTPMAWLSVIAYSLCLYIDFCGYSYMANGISEMLGFTPCPNFDHPYISRSVSEFWRRWHISLGEWFKENIYFPMGGSRVSVPRYIINTLVVWILTGIWHGTGFTFILWGLLSFILVTLEHVSKKYEGPLCLLERTKVSSHLYMIIYIPMSWALFMSPNISEYAELMKRLFPFGETAEYVNNLDFVPYIKSCWPYLLAAVLLSTSIPSKIWKKYRHMQYVAVPVLLAIFWFSVYFTVIYGSNPFMYVDF